MSPNKGVLKRSFDHLSFALMSFFFGFLYKTDIIIATSPPILCVLSTYWLSYFRLKPFVFEVRDLWPETIEAVGVIKKNLLINLLEKMELFLYKRASKVICVTEYFKKNIISRVPKVVDKIEVITNGTNKELFFPRNKDERLLMRYKLQNKFLVTYIGTHGMCHGLDFVIETAKNLENHPDIHFVFIGDGAKKENIVQKAKILDLKNVLFLNTVSKSEIAHYMSISDVSLVPLKKKDAFKKVIPSKIFESAAMQKPILLGVDGQAREIIEKYNAGLYYEPENKDDFIKKLLLLKNNKEIYQNKQEGCIKLADDYDRKKLAISMLDILKKIV